MNIRPATVRDVPHVLPMVAAICAMHQGLDPAKFGFAGPPAEMYRGWLTSRATDERSVFLLADRNPDDAAQPHLVAFLIATVEREIPIYKVREYGFIHDLWVEENYRNEGVARQMVMLAVERFTEMGVDQVRLDTAADNDAARALFLKCGFRVSTIEMLLELKDAR